jgi:hypothetical protein
LLLLGIFADLSPLFHFPLCHFQSPLGAHLPLHLPANNLDFTPNANQCNPMRGQLNMKRVAGFPSCWVVPPLRVFYFDRVISIPADD